MPASTPSSRGLPGLALALCAVLLLGGALLAPLQHGAFLLDDLPNLAGLERVHAEPDGAARFITGGIAGPGGRPVALASFAVQAGDWPYRPGPFKPRQPGAAPRLRARAVQALGAAGAARAAGARGRLARARRRRDVAGPSAAALERGLRGMMTS